jgi:hypothetical protein
MAESGISTEGAGCALGARHSSREVGRSEVKAVQIRAIAAASRREKAARNRRAIMGPNAADCAEASWADGVPPTATIFGPEPELFEDATGRATEYTPVGTLAEPERALWAAPWFGGLGNIIRPAPEPTRATRTRAKPASVSKPIVIARKRDGRPVCERCGQSFRQSGVGYQWHVANRPDCAARA